MQAKSITMHNKGLRSLLTESFFNPLPTPPKKREPIPPLLVVFTLQPK